MTFGVDLRDIQPYNSETHHYYTESEQQNYNDRRKTAQGITCEFLIESDHSQDYGNDEHDIAEDGHYLHGEAGKRCNVCYGVFEKSLCAPF